MRRTVMVVLAVLLTTMAMVQVAAAERPPVWINGVGGVQPTERPPVWIP